MPSPTPRPLPPPTLAALYPPIRGYRYFDAPEGWAFRPKASVDEVQQAWWLAEHALLAYERSAKVASTLSSTGYRAQIARDRASSSFAYAAIGADHGVLAFRGTEALTPGDSWRKLASVARDWWIDARVQTMIDRVCEAVAPRMADFPAAEPIIGGAAPDADAGTDAEMGRE